ncbi:MAG TPA: ZIP family metal transporter [Acidobacteriaceae bacterium]|nr:ZIP family metal transporter [Terriglobia bacterium]HVC91924.1 ZIP family metal transporter [Acidobacteriaceae bacterium]
MAHVSTPFGIVLLLGLVAGMADVVGGLLLLRMRAERFLHGFVAFGAGFLIAVALVEMMPESFQVSPASASLWILAGFCGVHLMEHTLVPHLHMGEETHKEEFLRRTTAYSVTIGLAAHTFFDGIAIASGFAFSSALGWLIFTGMLLHKLPEGFTVGSVMLASGRSARAAFTAACILGAATVAGVGAIYFLPGFARIGLPLSAGVALYVAGTDLLPEVNRAHGLRYRLLFFFGVGAFLLARWIS